MEQMALWEMVLLGIGVLLLLFWLGPGLKTAFQQRREASREEWMSVLIPIAIVVAFVTLLIVLI
ncbi:MAG: hypothetical protein RQ736_05165 [Thiogranum sp.]|nr:hypothetical protein [Thiogranum sp.]